MKQALAMFFGMIVLFSSLLGEAQQNATAVVPTLVRFNGTLSDINGKPLTGVPHSVRRLQGAVRDQSDSQLS